MATGIIRNIDNLGRATIPMEFRRHLKINTGDPMEICLEEGSIRIKPCRLQCVCCGDKSESRLVENNGVLICRKCLSGFNREEMK